MEDQKRVLKCKFGCWLLTYLRYNEKMFIFFKSKKGMTAVPGTSSDYFEALNLLANKDFEYILRQKI